MRTPFFEADETTEEYAAAQAREMGKLLSTALNMLELIASRMPAGASLRNTIEAECAAMRSASRAMEAAK